ncbi:type I-C CRISPR-associated protein Cas5c [Truepera radiovictrix]|uniref:pre-crRNA processing endonuclease n=1 Tax=Truepera radiovictrix (strain DSM 17093 / CIP 108686 / LMG 22925 / RQ-24) TaxID=649638 RepID=D7CYD9_TRURR|nr:type I-C CRISPR-associated protein Cas5c [Truepera radiovictrix]ADI14778.1 CRISPR-associated protein Cas5 family [Truepera radiovictrix DSM 17093]WMT56671.1 type I-C CRISPR-associated protein Cas5c [Truepera radiovictrix]
MLTLKVWGDYACFTRPENKAERVSYDVMTPSAARGVLEAVFWKPEFTWRVREIIALKPVKRLSILRNEVNTLASERAAKGWAANGGGFDAESDRAQRHALVLRDVAYLIRAEMVLRPHATDPLTKYTEIFERRAEKGQAFAQPYLGTREFSAFFSLPDGSETPANLVRQLGGEYAERAGELSLGRMLFDLEFQEAAKGRLTYRQHSPEGGRWVAGDAVPRFFDAKLTDGGVLRVPPELYGETS